MGAYQDISEMGGFSITYGGRESPFIGIDSSAPDPYIAPNALTKATFNAIVIDNTLCLSNWQAGFTFGATGNCIGVGDLLGVPFAVYLSASGGTSEVTVYSFPNYPNPSGVVTMGPVAVPNFTGLLARFGSLTFKNVNGVCFFSWPSLPYILQHNNSAVSILTAYLGASYLDELNGRLLALDVWQYASGVVSEFPYQFAWSAASGAYSQFNPLVGGLVTGAGFNNLPDVEDTITGYFNVGPTGYIIRDQGITEVTPLNQGILPFDFNHMWASHKGIGSIYPTTVKQYGSVGAFFSDTDIFTIGYEGINTLCGKAKSAIYNDLIITCQGKDLAAGFGPLLINGEPFLAYTISAFNIATNQIITWLLNFTTKEWFKFIQNFSQEALFQYSPINQVINNANSANTLFQNVTLDNGASITAYWLGLQTLVPPGQASSITFCAEELMIGHDITIDGIYVYYNTSNSLPLNFVINGITYTPVSTVTGLENIWLYAPSYPANALTYTAFTPQLTMTFLNTTTQYISFLIGKVVLFGHLEKSQRPV